MTEERFDDLRRPLRRDLVDRPPKYRSAPSHLSVVELRLAETRLDCTTFSPQVTALVVGENPGPNTHADMPLFPWPATSSAGRLLQMSGMTPGEYLGGAYRRNLCDYHWLEEDAVDRAREIITALFDMPKDFRVVLCGRKVSDAFGLWKGFWRAGRLESRQQYVVVPHPSGVNRVYNEWSARQSTREWMRWAVLGEDMPDG